MKSRHFAAASATILHQQAIASKLSIDTQTEHQCAATADVTMNARPSTRANVVSFFLDRATRLRGTKPQGRLPWEGVSGLTLGV